jgi:hypothetical protein
VAARIRWLARDRTTDSTLFRRPHAEFDVQLPIQSLFTAPTIAGIAQAVDVPRWAAQGGGVESPDTEHEEFEP